MYYSVCRGGWEIRLDTPDFEILQVPNGGRVGGEGAADLLLQLWVMAAVAGPDVQCQPVRAVKL